MKGGRHQVDPSLVAALARRVYQVYTMNYDDEGGDKLDPFCLILLRLCFIANIGLQLYHECTVPILSVPQ